MLNRFPVEAAWPLHPKFVRPREEGKFLWIGNKKYFVRGVTYGPFGNGRLSRSMVARDFSLMSRHGINAVRTFTPPPVWLLDSAAEHGLRVMAGVAWEQHIHFLDDRRLVASIRSRVRETARLLKDHPAVLGLSVGNEIPSSIVRWYGPRKIERFIQSLYLEAKGTDPRCPVTYVNYPTTEYLELPFLDLVCFNVYLEDPERLAAYLARLQNIAGERPLLLSEIGLDSRRSGLRRQSEVLEREVRTAFEGGCAGTFVFSWTDEWFRGGCEIEDWDFGLTDRQRRTKPALQAVERAFSKSPTQLTADRPKVSVVICVKNGAETIEECLEGVRGLNYPDYEVIVVDDGSTDRTAWLARKHDVRLISTENRGLSSARNTGLHAATGEIVAYLDADAYPDPDWLAYMAHCLADPQFVGAGGPNIAPPQCGRIAECVSHAPGGPQHILLDDRTAEHIPGCNMCFRRDALFEIGGFDTRFRIAGDDVDICWRLQKKGWKLAFCPAATVWHYPRSSVRGYFKQQWNYGRAEAALAQKWPEKFNRFGHLDWRGRLYGNGPILLARGVSRIYHGVWGTKLFQQSENLPPSAFGAFVHMPEFWLGILVLVGASFSGLFWVPLLEFFVGLLSLATGVLVVQALRASNQASFRWITIRPVWERTKLRLLTAWLYLIQPVARLAGRFSSDATYRGNWIRSPARLPRNRTVTFWSDAPKPLAGWLTSLESELRTLPVAVVRGDPYERWDLEVWSGLCGGVRTLASLEEHGMGKQMLHLAIRPKFSWTSAGLVGSLALLSVAASLKGAWEACGLLSVIALSVLFRSVQESAAASESVSEIFEGWHAMATDTPRSGRSLKRAARVRWAEEPLP